MQKKSLAEHAKIIVEEFKTKYKNTVLSDEYLTERGIESRLGSSPVREYQYGILFLRDDAVKILIDYIHKLEDRLKEKG